MEAKEVVLITGSSGFIGSALAQRLSQRYQVIGLDRDIPKSKLPGVAYHTVDITSDNDVKTALKEIKVAHGHVLHSVIHLVAYYSFSGKEDPRYESITVNGTGALIKHLREEFHVEQFIYSSSMLVYAPVRPGEKITDDSPLAPSWPYPQSKVVTEELLRKEQGNIPVVNLRIAGVYDDLCHSPTLSNQIIRIHENWLTSVPFPGDPATGQAFIHLEDLAEALELLIEKRKKLASFETLVLGEEDLMSFQEIQREAGLLLKHRPWPVIQVPKFVAAFGAKVMEKLPFMREPFIKPWMVPHAEEHFDVDITRLKRLLHWGPRRSLRESLPKMIANLKHDPHTWYAVNKLRPPFYRPLSTIGGEGDRNMWFAALATIFLGIWLMANPFGFGGVEGKEFWSEITLGLLVAFTGMLALIPTIRWVRWINAFFGFLVMFSPLLFHTSSAAAYSNDTLVGGLIILLSVYTPPTPKEDSHLGVPQGWTYNPSTAGQRIPIMFLAFFGFLFSRYLASYQLGHIPDIWEPFFGNGTKEVLESEVSKAFPVSDAGLGALTYLLDVIAACMGGRNRWRTMPWAVILFGFMIIPAGATSIVLVMLQPISVGAWCTVCLITAFIMLTMVPPAIDEVLASAQFLRRKKRAGVPFWQLFWLGSDEEEKAPEIPEVQKEGSLLFLFLSSLIGIWLMFAPYVLGIQGLAANNIYIIAALVVTFSVIATSEVARIVRFLNIPLAIWMGSSAWFFGEMSELAQWHSTILALILIALSFPLGKVSESYGSANRVIHWNPIRRH